jgi:hypothetical protein
LYGSTKLPVETGLVSGVAGRTGGLDEQQQAAIAVDLYSNHALNVAGSCPLAPQLLPAPGPEMGLAGRQGAFQGQRVHPGQHEHLTALRVLEDGGDQALFVEF